MFRWDMSKVERSSCSGGICQRLKESSFYPDHPSTPHAVNGCQQAGVSVGPFEVKAWHSPAEWAVCKM